MYQENFYNFTIAFQTYTASDITTEVQKNLWDYWAVPSYFKL